MNPKPTVALLGASLLGAALLASGCNQQFHTERNVSVFGKATKEVNADQVEIRITLESEAETNAAAMTLNAASLAKAFSLLDSYKSSLANIQKAGTRFGTRSNDKKKDSHYAETQISFTLTNLAHYDSLALKLASLPRISVSQSRYTLSQEIEMRSAVRDLAIQMAKEKAQSMAKAAGMKLGKPISISEGSAYCGGSLMSNSIQTSENEGSAQNTTGKFEIEANVQMSFEME